LCKTGDSLIFARNVPWRICRAYVAGQSTIGNL
jgi:hypothetical protein